MGQNKINCTPNLPCLLAIQIDFNYHQNPPWIYYILNLFPWMTKENIVLHGCALNFNFQIGKLFEMQVVL